MLEFQKLCPGDRERFLQYFKNIPEKGCEYAMVNLLAWGRQRVHFGEEFLTIFSQFDRASVYPFPVGSGDIKAALDAVLEDAHCRGIPCRLTSMTKEECETVERLYPGRFCFHVDREGFDYVYRIEDLATLKGKRYQSKRNFVNRFRIARPDCETVVLNPENLHLAENLSEKWFRMRQERDEGTNFHMEQVALRRVFSCWEALGMEGLVLMDGGEAIAMTVGSHLTEDTFDVHFEKALDMTDGSYAAINQAFAAYLQEKFPELKYLNREDDMGLEGLRKAKLSYHPDHLVEKYWARFWEDDDED